MISPSTFLIINPDYSVEGSIPNRFPKTIRSVDTRYIYRLPHPEIPAYVAGTNPYSVIYSLSRPEHSLLPVKHLHPAALRSISQSLAHARKIASPLHILGLVDNESPYGTRRALEETIRVVKLSQQPTFVHAGVWHPTPNEYHRGVEELRTLCTGNVTLASVFPVSEMGHSGKSQKFLDGIRNPIDADLEKINHLPLNGVSYLASDIPFPLTVLITNHQFHGLDFLVDALHETESQVHTFPLVSHTPKHVNELLNKYKFVQGISNRESYLDCYFGHNAHHEYYERLVVPSSRHILEMLISPHFGYGTPPHHTVVLVDEARAPDFDWLIDSFIKSRDQTMYACLILDTATSDGNILISNQSLNEDQSLYAQLVTL